MTASNAIRGCDGEIGKSACFLYREVRDLTGAVEFGTDKNGHRLVRSVSGYGCDSFYAVAFALSMWLQYINKSNLKQLCGSFYVVTFALPMHC